MNNINELIFVNQILTTKLTIRKAAKQLGLRRDDLIKRIKVMLKNDPENIRRLDIIILTNKILFGNLKIKEAAKRLKITEKELDRQIQLFLDKDSMKFKKYEQMKKST